MIAWYDSDLGPNDENIVIDIPFQPYEGIANSIQKRI